MTNLPTRANPMLIDNGLTACIETGTLGLPLAVVLTGIDGHNQPVYLRFADPVVYRLTDLITGYMAAKEPVRAAVKKAAA